MLVNGGVFEFALIIYHLLLAVYFDSTISTLSGLGSAARLDQALFFFLSNDTLYYSGGWAPSVAFLLLLATTRFRSSACPTGLLQSCTLWLWTFSVAPVNYDFPCFSEFQVPFEHEAGDENEISKQ